ncbi:MAG: hypothetical protein RLN63_03370, partial [Miltoncostaeaceae bacterium]
DLDPTAAVDDPTAEAADAADGNLVSGARLEQILLRVTNTDATNPQTITVLAGLNPPALEAGRGDLEVAIPSTDTVFMGPFESGRFVQAGGDLWIDVTAADIEVTAFRLPRRF